MHHLVTRLRHCGARYRGLESRPLRAFFIAAALCVCAWSAASAHVGSVGKHQNTQIGTVVVRNATNVYAWVDLQEGGSHLLQRRRIVYHPANLEATLPCRKPASTRFMEGQNPFAYSIRVITK
jgi:hypothetical protein